MAQCPCELGPPLHSDALHMSNDPEHPTTITRMLRRFDDYGPVVFYRGGLCCVAFGEDEGVTPIIRYHPLTPFYMTLVMNDIFVIITYTHNYYQNNISSYHPRHCIIISSKVEAR